MDSINGLCKCWECVGKIWHKLSKSQTTVPTTIGQSNKPKDCLAVDEVEGP